MSSVLQRIVENGELNDIIEVDEAITLVLKAMQSESNNKQNRKFRYDLSMCKSIEDVQRITYNGYLKRMGLSVI